MHKLQLAKRYADAGHKIRFYQDFYGHQWVKVQGGLMFWRSGRIQLSNDEIVELKRYINRDRSSRGDTSRAA